METSGLLFVSVFCNIQRKPQFEGNIRQFSKYPMIHNEILWKLELFALNSPFYKQIFKKSLEIPTKSISLQQQIPPRLSTMRTMVGLRFYMGI